MNSLLVRLFLNELRLHVLPFYINKSVCHLFAHF